MMKGRSSGILCHISSLPSPYGIGDLGPEAFRFVDVLARARQRYWQVLPLNPTDSALGNSPYSTYSAFGWNTLLISPDRLCEDGFLTQAELDNCRIPAEDGVPFDAVYARKANMLELAYRAFKARPFGLRAFTLFCESQCFWLDDHALFVVLKRKAGHACWADWPVDWRDRDPGVLKAVAVEFADELRQEKFFQFLFYRQWMAFQEYCSRQGVGLIGDIPIYVNYDSADVWRDPSLFKLDQDKRLTFVAGVPPDYFSRDGQRWGNPVYAWERHLATGFDWWMKRLRHNLAFFDIVRIDHFRAFAQCWEIPATELTAVRGAWRDVPGGDLFAAFQREFPDLPIIAEDLGIITPDVDALKERFGLPGMKVLLFAFHTEPEKSRDIPENFTPLSVVYTGTHDNNTIRGWYSRDITSVEKRNMLAYCGRDIPSKEINQWMIGAALRSPSVLAVIPLQDILGLGAEARMNTPSTVTGNWRWRFGSGNFSAQMADRLAALTEGAGR
ncbi:MAG: 4-alpha-glucanotransferase [Candidatus Omnitrophota bacterium]